MASTATNPARGDAAGLGNVDLRAANDTRESTETISKNQGRDRVRRGYLVTKLHALGPAPLSYFIADLERGADIRETLETCAALPADFIAAFGGDQSCLPFMPLTGGNHDL